MRSFIRTWLGEERPKQYCTFVGNRSMLRHTWDRALALAPPERVVTVVAHGHRRYLSPTVEGVQGRLLEQPRDCGTGPGIFLPLTLVAARDPAAIALILPADHFIHPEARFHALAQRACELAGRAGRLIILGAVAHAPETDYGWILPVNENDGALRAVERFEEKPDRARAASLLARGALWSTMVIAARVDTLWRLGVRLLPGMMRPFRELRAALLHPPDELPSSRIVAAIAAAYRRMPAVDFSRDLLQPSAQLTSVLPMRDVEWSDWGRPERVAETLRRLGKRPVFPAAGEAEASAERGDLGLPGLRPLPA
jgi:mannose-1-phosphate guanylyltransferase